MIDIHDHKSMFMLHLQKTRRKIQQQKKIEQKHKQMRDKYVADVSNANVS